MKIKFTFIALFFLWHSTFCLANSVRIVYCGDTNFAESYQERFAHKGQGNVLLDFGYDYSIEEIGALTKRADYAIANLETVITSLRKSPHRGKKSYIHYSHITKTPEALKRWGIDAVSLGNNHTMDFGVKGLKETVDVLDRESMSYFGGGLSDRRARREHLTHIRVGKHSFPLVTVGAFEYRPSYQKKYSFYASGNVGGVNGWTDESSFDQIKALRYKYPKAFIVAYPHWGANYHWRSNEQKRRAYAMVDSGADLILGHGAHMVQEVEQYKGRWIVYSLGNFVFNTKGRYTEDKKPPYSLIAELFLSPEEKGIRWSLRLYPIFCNNRETHFRSRFISIGEMAFVKEQLLRREGKNSALRRELKVTRDGLGPYLEGPSSFFFISK